MRDILSQALADVDQADPDAVLNCFRSHLEEVVTLHAAMFNKLLFEADGVPLELAELFEDVANTYMGLSERISEHHLQRHSHIEEELDPIVEPTLWRA
jgi:predicted amidohydrolase